MSMKLKWEKIVGVLVLLLLLGACLPAYGAVISVENSLLPVLTVEVSRQDQAIIGEEFSIVYLIKNISDKPAFNITYAFHVVGAADLYPFTVTPPPVIDRLDPGASATLPVKVAIDRDAREKEYNINGIVSCLDATMSSPVNYSCMSWVPISFTTVKPNLTVTELTVLEQDPDVKAGFTIRLGLKNSSLIYDLRNVLIQLEGGENFEIMEITNKKEILKISTNQTASVEFKLRAKENRTGNTIILSTSFNYIGGAMDDKREELFIPIGDEEEEEDTGNGKKPQVIIKRYSLSKDQVLAGDRIDLTLEIENTNIRPVKNVLINFGVESSTSDMGGASSSTVFAPVGSSNTFHVDEIRGKSVITNTITFAVDAGAMARTYIVPVTITYEDEKGLYDNLFIRDNVNIQVTQMAKLSVTSMTLPANATVGMPTPVMAEFVNSGKVELVDFTVRLEGDFEVMDASLYMAKMMIGATTSYTGMLIASTEGEKEGKLIISYLDNSNQEVVDEYPFMVSVMPMDDFGDFGDPGMMFPEGGFTPPEEGESTIIRILKGNWLAILLGLIIIILLIYIVRIKKKAKEEFFDD